MKETKHIYTLELTERQAKLLSYACDQFSRLICGQDMAYQDLFEQAWEKRCKEATGNSFDGEWDGGWYYMRHDAEKIANDIKKRFWGLDRQTLNGIHYDDTADILWDIHRVLRHQFYKDRGDKSIATVDSENPTSSVGSEPLAIVRRTDIPSQDKEAYEVQYQQGFEFGRSLEAKRQEELIENISKEADEMADNVYNKYNKSDSHREGFLLGFQCALSMLRGE